MPSRSSRKKNADSQALHEAVQRIADERGARELGVAVYDWHTRTRWSHNGGAWFHAASTIKVPVLLGVFGAIHRGEGDLHLKARIHVRNRFLSAADGTSFRVGSGRDANGEVHRMLGRTMKVGELAHHMITTSSNLATNLLVEVVGVEAIRRTLHRLRVDEGVEFRRGVEDEAAFEAGINNRVTADGLLKVLRVMEDGQAFSPEASRAMLDILHEQEFRSGIPAGLPDDAQVAHKTGEISTAAHDAGVVYLPGRAPYALVVLTAWDAARTAGRSATIADVSRAVHEFLTRDGGGDA